MRYSRKLTRTSWLAGAAVALATAAACGGQPNAAPSPSAPPGNGAPAVATTTPKPGKPQFNPPAGAVKLAAAKIDGTALPKTFPKEVYTVDGGKTLVVRAEEGGCQHALGVASEQTPQRVVVDLSETKAETGQMCTMDLRHPVISVPLAAPLGERTVVLKHSSPK